MKASVNRFLYYIAFILCVILRLANSSTIVNFNSVIIYLMIAMSSILFIIKIILDNHSVKNCFLIGIGAIFFFYVYLITGISFFLTGFLAIVAMKNIDIKQVIKIDIAIKLLFLISHALIYSYNYFMYNDIMNPMGQVTVKGITHSLYLQNPNVVGTICLYLILDFHALKEKLNLKDLLIGAIVIVLAYIISKSRTPLMLYMLFIILYFLKSKNIINFLSKYSYFIVGIATFITVQFLNSNNSIVLAINKLFSDRLNYSMHVYKYYGLSILPNAVANNALEKFIIDNYFVRCFINYGFITFIIVGLLYLKIPKEGYKIAKCMFIISCIYLFFETISINVGFALPFLIMGNIILYQRKEGD